MAIDRLVIEGVNPWVFPVGGLTGRALLRYTVQYQTTELTCSPDPVLRGDTVTCSMTPSEAYTVVRQRAQGQGFQIQQAPGTAHAPNETYEWSGTAVADTDVEITIETSQGQRTLMASFAVEARDWPTLRPGNPQVQRGLRGTMEAYPGNALLGNAAPELSLDVFRNLPVQRADGGPNDGLAFLAQPLPSPDFMIFIHPGLDPTPPGLQPGDPGYQPSHRWHDDQNGLGSGTCTQAVFNILVPEVERHEGVTRAANSHWGITERAYRDLSPEQAIESLYTQAPFDDGLRANAWEAWVDFHNSGEYRLRQTIFDQADRLLINNRLGCVLDYNDLDP